VSKKIGAGYTLLSLLLLVPGCSRSAGDPPGARGHVGVRVRTAPVEVRDVTFEVKALGSLEAEELIQITGEVEGAVSQVLFHEGDRVGPDTILVRIDPERYRLEADRAEATYQKTLADMRRAQDDLKRREKLAEEQLVPAEELIRARQEAEQLVAQAAGDRAARDIALQNRARSEVRAPRSGVINTRAVETGRWVKAGDALATLVDTTRLRLRFKVSESESLKVHKDQEIRFRVAALGDEDFAARIYHVGEVADPATRQVEVVAWVRNPGVLKPGFFAEVSLATASRKQAIVVPEGAIQASEDGFIVYTVESGKARVHRLDVGLRTKDGVVEIVSGLKGGETVVVEGSDRLADGVPVEEASVPAGASPAPASGKAGS
jgi:membrane fusion protein, multidrug efflux system